MLSTVKNDLQRAVEHRYSLTKPRLSLEGLWKQLKASLTQGSTLVQQSNTCVQILLDIDNTLLYTVDLDGVFGTHGCRARLDSDMQRFYSLASSFWQWADDASELIGEDSWPQLLPWDNIEGKEYTMWFPDDDTADSYPVPQFIAPVWDQQGTLTHYIAMFGTIIFGTIWSGEKCVDSKHLYMAVIPAEITLLTYLRYELGRDIDNMRRPGPDATASNQTQDWDSNASGHTEVQLYLATAGSESYLTRVWQVLEQLLSCQHGGMVFAGKASFRKQFNATNSHAGIKTAGAFNLRETGYTDGLICCRIAVDDHISWWKDKEESGKYRLMPVMGWYGRFASLDYGEAGCIRNDTQKIDFEVSLNNFYSQRPVAPEGLRRLLPEVVQLICQATNNAEPKLPPQPAQAAIAAAIDVTVPKACSTVDNTLMTGCNSSSSSSSNTAGNSSSNTAGNSSSNTAGNSSSNTAGNSSSNTSVGNSGMGVHGSRNLGCASAEAAPAAPSAATGVQDAAAQQEKEQAKKQKQKRKRITPILLNALWRLFTWRHQWHNTVTQRHELPAVLRNATAQQSSSGSGTPSKKRKAPADDCTVTPEAPAEGFRFWTPLKQRKL